MLRKIFVLAESCAALFVDNDRNLIDRCRNMLQPREQFETVILGVLTQVTIHFLTTARQSIAIFAKPAI